MDACPPATTLAALAAGHVSSDEEPLLRQHVEVCTACGSALARMARNKADTSTILAPSSSGPASLRGSWVPPLTFDGFEIVRQLGQGGMGHVYLGRDVMLGRRVALKFIARDRPDQQTLDRFLVEARAIARLQHPNVVAIYRIGEVDEQPYLAYEFVAGEGLDQIAKPMPWQTALRIGLGLARGLAAAHRCGVLHRDIKPANAILATTGEVKLIDFGLAKLVDERRDADSPPLSTRGRPAVASAPDLDAANLTDAHAVMGTPLYLAPELWSGGAATSRSDVYALGVLLYELCTGRHPHALTPLTSLAFQVLTIDLPPVRSNSAELPEVFAHVIDRCVCRLPEDRFPSAQELRRALEEADALCRAFQLVRPEAESPGMDPDAAARVTESFGRLAPRADVLVARFYERVFEAAPEVRSLFPPDMTGQRMKVAAALQLAVENLRNPERLIPMLEDLGRKHAPYGVEAGHFDVVGRALLGALAELEGAAWSPSLEAAWTGAYGEIAAAMRRGLRAARVTSGAISQSGEQSGRFSTAPPTYEMPRTRYTRCGDAAVAYQIVDPADRLGPAPAGPAGPGRGDTPALVLVPAWITHLELAWEHPAPAALLRALASTARLILFDPRGVGMSDRHAATGSLDERVTDLEAVMAAADAQRAMLLGIGAGCAVAARFAAIHPERVRSLVLYAGAAWSGAAEAVDGGAPPWLDEMERAIDASWGDPLFLDVEAPSMAGDPGFERWWATYLRTGLSLGGARRMLRANAAIDVRGELPSIRAPALVLRRAGDRRVSSLASRDLAARIRNARHVELPGQDHLPFAGDIAPLIHEIRRFALDPEGKRAAGSK